MNATERLCRCGQPLRVLGAEGDFVFRERECQACAAKRQESERVEALENRLLQSGIDRSLWSFDPNLGDMRMLSWCLAHRESWMWIGGPTGKCKSRSLARAAVVTSWRSIKPVNIQWIDCGKWLDLVADRYSAAAKAAGRSAVADAERADILILDDFGQEMMDERMRSMVFGLIDRRYVAYRRTWVSTNSDGDDMEKRLGPTRWPQILRRFEERGYMLTWSPTAKDGRGGWEEHCKMIPESSRHWTDDL